MLSWIEQVEEQIFEGSYSDSQHINYNNKSNKVNYQSFIQHFSSLVCTDKPITNNKDVLTIQTGVSCRNDGVYEYFSNAQLKTTESFLYFFKRKAIIHASRIIKIFIDSNNIVKITIVEKKQNKPGLSEYSKRKFKIFCAETELNEKFSFICFNYLLFTSGAYKIIKSVPTLKQYEENALIS